MYMMRTPGKELPKGIRELHDGQVFETIGATVRCIATPGHTEDHASFLMEEEGALFTGDAVLGEGATTFEDLDKYLGSLRRMLDKRSMAAGDAGLRWAATGGRAA